MTLLCLNTTFVVDKIHRMLYFFFEIQHTMFGGMGMPDYKKMYLFLFNAVTDALAELEHQNPGRAALVLQKAQADTEEMYIQGED